MAEVANNKAAVLSSRRDDGRAVLRRALDHHAGHPLDDDAAAAPRERAARHHAPRLAVHVERVHREGSADLHRHGRAGRDLDPERAPREPHRERGADARADLAPDPAGGRRAGRQGRAHDREGRPAHRGHDAVLRHPRLHHDVGRPPAAGDRQHAQRVLRGDGRHPVQVRAARSTSSSATRSSACSARRSRSTMRRSRRSRARSRCCRRSRSSTARAPPRTRPPIRIGIGINTGNVITGVDRLDARAAVHRDRRRDERGLAPRQRRRLRRDHHLRGHVPPRRRPRRGDRAAAGEGEGQGRGAQGLSASPACATSRRRCPASGPARRTASQNRLRPALGPARGVGP